jgi:cysteine-rich repeat protein
LNDGETCDDGNIEDADACRNDCTLAVCGDGITRRDLELGEPGFESCDDGNLNDVDACTSNCALAFCGDGILRLDLVEGAEGFEFCDDANGEDNDACIACVVAVCGDGVVREDLAEGDDGYEDCDDGNLIAEDGCDDQCLAERPSVNGDLGTIAFCGYGEARRPGGNQNERIGVYNSANAPLQRHNGHTNRDSFCRANGWEASNTGRGNSNHSCAQVMTYWSDGGVSTGAGSWNSGRYTPNRAPGSHIYMTCIGGQ